MYHPSRGGVRGGRDQFNWDDIKGDKHRENYLGHSIKAPVGRWQKGKDLHWYMKDRNGGDAAAKDELRRIQEEEDQAMQEMLGLTPKRSRVQQPQLSEKEISDVMKTVKDGQDSAPSYAEGERVQGLGFAPAPGQTKAKRPVQIVQERGTAPVTFEREVPEDNGGVGGEREVGFVGEEKPEEARKASIGGSEDEKSSPTSSNERVSRRMKNDERKKLKEQRREEKRVHKQARLDKVAEHKGKSKQEAQSLGNQKERRAGRSRVRHDIEERETPRRTSPAGAQLRRGSSPRGGSHNKRKIRHDSDESEEDRRGGPRWKDGDVQFRRDSSARDGRLGKRKIRHDSDESEEDRRGRPRRRDGGVQTRRDSSPRDGFPEKRKIRYDSDESEQDRRGGPRWRNGGLQVRRDSSARDSSPERRKIIHDSDESEEDRRGGPSRRDGGFQVKRDSPSRHGNHHKRKTVYDSDDSDDNLTAARPRNSISDSEDSEDTRAQLVKKRPSHVGVHHGRDPSPRQRSGPNRKVRHDSDSEESEHRRADAGRKNPLPDSDDSEDSRARRGSTHNGEQPRKVLAHGDKGQLTRRRRHDGEESEDRR